MVVTRKKPSAPAPPTSRTNSTQALPRATHATSTHSNLPAAPETHSHSPQPPSRDTLNGTPKSKHKTKSKKLNLGVPLKRGEKRSLLDHLFFLFLATFASYALYTCPSDINHDSPVCRSLATYRTRVLEPYVIPPLRAAITHPVIVQPYEKYAKPVYQSYIRPATPYVAAAQRRAAPYANAAMRFSKHTSSRVWNGIIKPYWVRAVMPRYALYVEPHLNKYVSPIIKRLNYYHLQVDPYIRNFAHKTSVYAHWTQKYALAAYNRVKPHALRAYDAAKPHVSRGYAHVRPLLCQGFGIAQSKGKYVVSEIMASMQVALGRIGDLRRQFVDPHVLRIWEKAVEKSGPSPIQEPTFTSSINPSGSVSLDNIPDADTESENVTVEMELQSTAIASSATITPIPSSSVIPDVVVNLTEEPETLDALSEPTPAPTPVETLEKAASVAAESVAHASTVIEEVEKEIKLAEAEQVPLTPTPAPAETPEPTIVIESLEAEKELPSALPSEPLNGQQVAGEDLEDFLREIGLDDEQTPEPEPEIFLPVQGEVDEETKKAATAAKRAEIVGRHTRWQSELETLAKDLEIRVKQEIDVIRKEAIVHIGRLPSDKDSSTVEGKGKEVIERVQADGEKLLKGLDAYIKKLMSSPIAEEELGKEREKWDKVVDKVEGKFKDVVRTIQEEVHDWYVGIREKESAAVLAAANQVKTLAGQAQADLGLDYAWLDDVTYNDWQKYHDLMRTFERFDQTARSLQNGTHTDAPEDQLIPVLNGLDSEVQDMIVGFALKMNSIVREGNRWLSGYESIYDPDPEADGDECEEAEEPEVSILPISPAPVLEKVDPANVIIGKSAEQIEKVANEAIVEGRIEL
ncbi:hypothetical protein P691DRAFT_775049 [Macrolepiota fuliginosa MF-IS2]|uniref:Uncharacterized protein n=1 Tax=Macrolepiota fuliginosa MF-IS2 TaxID=1400762 RepID=A0A9P6C4N0_9AGAR|nr:hypothetical protein P691DRAFT_775049 [Macrolepiota fuliginosa MF-IS2]